MRHDEWCDSSLETMDQEVHSGLVFDFIALRDIEKDQEVLIDYGKEWQDAWDQHVRTWVPPAGSQEYMAAYELNNDLDLVIQTFHEASYSDNLLLYVHAEYRFMSGLKESPFDLYSCRVLDRYTVKDETMYMVELFSAKDSANDMTVVQYFNEVLFAIPRDAFVFRDAPYSRDHQLRSSFRHEMMIPDDMFPDSWKTT